MFRHRLLSLRIATLILVAILIILVISRRPVDISREKLFLADAMWFTFLIYHDGEMQIDTTGVIPTMAGFRSSDHHNSFYRELIFVHTEEEAVGFPNNVIVAWPNPERTPCQLYYMNKRMNTEIGHESLNLYGLEHPITMYDLVANWENVVPFVRDTIISSQFSRFWLSPECVEHLQRQSEN